MTFECLYDYDKLTPGFQYLSATLIYFYEEECLLCTFYGIYSQIQKSSFQNLGFEFLNNLNQIL